MSKVICKVCKKKFINQKFLDVHMLEHPEPDAERSKGWVTPYGFTDFAEPVTYEEACAVAAAMSKEFRK